MLWQKMNKIIKKIHMNALGNKIGNNLLKLEILLLLLVRNKSNMMT